MHDVGPPFRTPKKAFELVSYDRCNIDHAARLNLGGMPPEPQVLEFPTVRLCRLRAVRAGNYWKKTKKRVKRELCAHKKGRWTLNVNRRLF